MTNYNVTRVSIDKGKPPPKRNALKEGGLLKKSDTLLKNVEVSFFQNYINGSRKTIEKSPN